jgi:Cu(I)/Ag(I) efflux system membrane fusion protein
LLDVFEIDLPQVKSGARVFLSVAAYPERTFEGRVEWISNTIDATRRTATARVTLTNKEGLLKPGMYASARIETDPKKTLAVPHSALLRLAGKPVVFVEKGTSPDGRVRFERTPVVVSEDYAGDLVPVLHGLDRSDKIVTKGALLLSGML